MGDEYYTILPSNEFYSHHSDSFTIDSGFVRRTPEKAIQAKLQYTEDPLATAIMLRDCLLVKVTWLDGCHMAHVKAIAIISVEDYLDG